MSIKSQKSLNEECSEIWERSYSVRTGSEDSLSESDETDCLSHELLSALSPAVLSKLRRSFTRAHSKSQTNFHRKVEMIMRQAAAEEGIDFVEKEPQKVEDGLWCDEHSFVTALDNIFGSRKFSAHAQKLFQLLDPFSSKKVSWSSLLDRLVLAGLRRTRSRAEAWRRLDEDMSSMRQLMHCRRETIIKLVSILTEDSFCYAAVSKGGRVGVYSGDMRLQHDYNIWYHRSGITTRVKKCWITDAVYLSDVQCLLLSASDRSFTIYDSSTLSHNPVYCITGVPNIPTCLAYTSGERGVSELMFGDARGLVTRLQFSQPRVALLHKKFSDRINSFFWMELSSPPHDAFCTPLPPSHVHKRTVRRVAYVRTHSLLSCDRQTAVLRNITGNVPDYVYTVNVGITCFHMSPQLHLLATGSRDGSVRLWQSTQAAPHATLPADGQAAVLDVAVVASREVVVGFTKNCLVHIWDLHEECLLQTLKVKFPFLGVLGRRPEFGICSLYPGPPRIKLPREPDDRPPSLLEPPLVGGSRRASACRALTGGLQLLEADELDPSSDRESNHHDSSELIITCCDHTFTLRLCGATRARDCEGELLPPPGNTRRARRPSCWELGEVAVLAPILSAPPRPLAPRASALLPPPAVRGASFADTVQLDALIEKAGLQGILEKDFVLMMGLKHDLNQKLAELELNMSKMCGPVSAGAPHLALQLREPAERAPAGELTARYAAVMRLFPATSTVGSTPRSVRADSGRSTPKKRTSRA